MDEGRSYVFKIDAFTPETIPMDRLAAYMADLAKLLGNRERVHFLAIQSGSAELKYRVDEDATTDAYVRVRAAGAGTGPKDALQAFHALSRKLAEDESAGAIQEVGGAEILRFPDRRPEPQEELKSFGQLESLDGVVQRVARLGKEASVTVETRDGQSLVAKTLKDTARRLARHIFGPEVRLHGYGTWKRTRDGVWILSEFRIRDFDVLRDTPLSDVIAELHAVQGSEWPTLRDPWGALDELRRDDPETTQ